MADRCCVCNTRDPEGGTKHLFLPSGWIEFCPACGDSVELTNSQTGEVRTLNQLCELCESQG